ncbi:MAG: RsmD family RNA methyltransferase [Chitinispirillales bacterium]|jgi:16S rRNA (guanine(966)-N(2))-methyltransferase RsmD|nr:RsmD family RNA methyltransferase [Chitinispirillales bacterium]
MKLRIISGELKGRRITIPDNTACRPTLERVRESVAEIVKKKVRGATAADLCAGSGAFGFEMLSRGAGQVDFVEADKIRSIRIADVARDLGLGGRAKIVRDDVRKFISGRVDLYDIVYYDPPYDNADLRELIPQLLPLLKTGGLLIYERRRGQREKKSAGTGGKLGIKDVRVYSDTVIEIYGNDNHGSGIIDVDSDLSGDV